MMTTARAALRKPRTTGFTLIELLVVIAIIITLVALLGAGMGRARASAKDKATRALIGKIKIALQNYHSEFRDYPPDGFDVEIPGTDDQGAPVGYGTERRKLKNTAILMYFLCRPVIKITTMGDPNDFDERNLVKTPVGPFLELSASNYSRGRGDGQGDLNTFDPNFVWSGTRGKAFWDAPNNYRLTEIIDAHGRPLCYDKVKTSGPKYYQIDRFHSQDLGASSTGGKGSRVHPDQNYLENEMPVIEDRLCDDPAHGPPETSDQATWYRWHPDPRAKVSALAPDGCLPKVTAGVNTHEPKSVGTYDLWSFGSSYTNPRDDVTSWGE